MFVSILAPMYNCAEFLLQLVASISAQTHQEWEMILLDDESSDGSFDIAQQLTNDDARFRVVRAPHSGSAGALNAATWLARGDLIARQDADDWCAPTRLEEQIEFMHETKADIVTCNMMRCYSDGRKIPCGTVGMSPLQYLNDRVPKGPPTATALCKREAYHRVGLHDTDLPGAEFGSTDSDWNFRALLADPPLNWVHLNRYLYFYRDHASQSTKLSRGINAKAHIDNQNKYRAQILARYGTHK